MSRERDTQTLACTAASTSLSSFSFVFSSLPLNSRVNERRSLAFARLIFPPGRFQVATAVPRDARDTQAAHTRSPVCVCVWCRRFVERQIDEKRLFSPFDYRLVDRRVQMRRETISYRIEREKREDESTVYEQRGLRWNRRCRQFVPSTPCIDKFDTCEISGTENLPQI